MVAGYFRHEFKQGEAYSVDIDFRDSQGAIDTSGWTGAASIQTLDATTPLDSNNVEIAFTVSFPASGTVRLALPASKTVQLPAKRYLYDVKLLDSSSQPVYYLDGDVVVRQSYTP